MPNLFESLGVEEGQIVRSFEIIDPTVGIPSGEAFYGYQDKGYGRPEKLAPKNEDSGGFLFFPNDVAPEFVNQLVALAGLASVNSRRHDQYRVQALVAPEGMEQELGYLRKLVFADRFALRYLFNAISDEEYHTMPRQPVDVAEVVAAFLQEEREKHGTMFGSPTLAGKFGGNGHSAQEQLSFGFAIENSYYGVASVWSRAWNVTK